MIPMSKQKISVFAEVYNKHYFSGLYNLRDKDQIKLCIFSHSLLQIIIYVLKQSNSTSKTPCFKPSTNHTKGVYFHR